MCLFAPTTVAGLGSPLTYANFSSLSASFGTGSNSLSIDGPNPSIPVTVSSAGPLAANLHFTGDYTGQISLPATSTANVSVDGSLTGTLLTAGTLHSLTINGNDTGTISAASIDTIFLPNAHPDASGLIFSATQAGARRTISALSATATPLANLSFAIAYDGSSSSNPQAAVRVNNPSSTRFDLLLDTPRAADAFDLSRVDSATSAPAGVRNLTISGSLLSKMTPAQISLLGAPAVTAGGVYLPADNLAAVAARKNIAAGSILAKSLQAIAFSTATDFNGKTRTAPQLAADKDRWKGPLKSVLAIDPKTRKPYTKVVPATETLRVVADSSDLGVFVGKLTGPHPSLFDPHDLFIADHDNDGGTVQATLAVAKKPKAGTPIITDLTFTAGTGGSVRTNYFLNHLGSSTPLADLSVNAGPAEVLDLDAPSVQGKVQLFGGKLISDLPIKSKPVTKPKPAHK